MRNDWRLLCSRARAGGIERKLKNEYHSSQFHFYFTSNRTRRVQAKPYWLLYFPLETPSGSAPKEVANSTLDTRTSDAVEVGLPLSSQSHHTRASGSTISPHFITPKAHYFYLVYLPHASCTSFRMPWVQVVSQFLFSFFLRLDTYMLHRYSTVYTLIHTYEVVLSYVRRCVLLKSD